MSRPTDALQSIPTRDLTKEQCLLILDQIAKDWGIRPLSDRARAETGPTRLRKMVQNSRSMG